MGKGLVKINDEQEGEEHLKSEEDAPHPPVLHGDSRAKGHKDVQQEERDEQREEGWEIGPHNQKYLTISPAYRPTPAEQGQPVTREKPIKLNRATVESSSLPKRDLATRKTQFNLRSPKLYVHSL